jgi:hypothetical protein
MAMASAQTPLTLLVSSESVSAGGTVQIKIFAAAPAHIGKGAIAMDLDPSVFGEVSQVSIFSATGDAIGYANVSGRHVDARFSSRSGGIGQLPGLPIMTVAAPVNVGANAAVTIDSSGSEWLDADGGAYATAVKPGRVTGGGSLSIGSVTPGGGVLPSGTVVRIDGAGFDGGTHVAIDGVGLASERFVNNSEIDVTLGGPAEMTGKRVRVTNAAGTQAEYFSALPSAPANTQYPLAGLRR